MNLRRPVCRPPQHTWSETEGNKVTVNQRYLFSENKGEVVISPDTSNKSSAHCSPLRDTRVSPRRISPLRPKLALEDGRSLSISIDINDSSRTDTKRKTSTEPKLRRISSVLQFANQYQNFTPDSLIDFIRENIQGRDSLFNGPFGKNRVIYCDYTASGKPLKFIEGFIHEFVNPFYGNTHTSSSISSLQTTQYRSDARRIVKNCVNASTNDAVIFCGSGTTAAIHKFIHVLNLTEDTAKNTVIIVGPFEHHSNILPWKETGAKLVRVKDTDHGLVNLEDLEDKLMHHKKLGSSIICAFSAASNVTGILTDTVAIAELTHKYGGISVWDYATGAPYLPIDMNPTPTGYKDAVFCSPHKFIGGVGTPGLLIAKRNLFKNPVPGGCGGGTVIYVTQETHTYVDDVEEREEGGTPGIIESIRAGMAFQLKQAVGEETIMQREKKLCNEAFCKWRKNSNIYILGSHTAERLAIFALLFRNPESGKLLHHNFVATLLNDLYGIQARGGCACAGPYTQDLLGIEEDMAQRFSWFLRPANDNEEDGFERNLKILKPGFVRLNLPFFLDDETTEYILHAVDMVASNGWRLLPLYTFDPQTGDWKHRSWAPNIRSLFDISYIGSGIRIRGSPSLSRRGEMQLQDVVRNASETIGKATELSENVSRFEDADVPLQEKNRHLIWFLLPEQAALYLKNPVLKLFTSTHLPPGFDPDRTTLKRVKRRFRSMIVHALGENNAKRLTFIRKSSIIDQLHEVATGKNGQRDQANPDSDDGPPSYSDVLGIDNPNFVDGTTTETTVGSVDETELTPIGEISIIDNHGSAKHRKKKSKGCCVLM